MKKYKFEVILTNTAEPTKSKKLIAVTLTEADDSLDVVEVHKKNLLLLNKAMSDVDLLVLKKNHKVQMKTTLLKEKKCNV